MHSARTLIILLSIFSLLLVNIKGHPLRYRPQQPLVVTRDTLSRSVLIVSISSVHNKNRVDAQLQAFGKYFLFYALTEEDYPKCTLCGDMPGFYDKRKPWDMDIGWRCAQQRHMQAINLYAQSKIDDGWLVIIDDDTAVNPMALLEVIAKLPRDATVGDPKGGGAGFIFGPETLKALIVPTATASLQFVDGDWVVTRNETVLDLCEDRVRRGAWCNLHSDWVLGDCLEAAGMKLTGRFEKMHQFCFGAYGVVGIWSPEKPPPCDWVRSEMITCHYSDPAETLRIGECVDVQPAPATAAGRGRPPQAF